MFPVRYGKPYRFVLSFKYKTGRWIKSRIVIVILIYHRHKPIDIGSRTNCWTTRKIRQFSVMYQKRKRPIRSQNTGIYKYKYFRENVFNCYEISTVLINSTSANCKLGCIFQ
jgi:hypothetical protein